MRDTIIMEIGDRIKTHAEEVAEMAEGPTMEIKSGARVRACRSFRSKVKFKTF